MGTKTHALLEISWYHRMYNVVNEVSHKSRSLQLSSAVSDANLLFLLTLSVLAVKSCSIINKVQEFPILHFLWAIRRITGKASYFSPQFSHVKSLLY